LVYVPQDRRVFSGAPLFVGRHPVIWAEPIANWSTACHRILSWDVETIVPGHGPITDKSGVRAFKHYLEFVYAEAGKRYDAGVDVEDAARDISWDAFQDWIDPERVIVNRDAAYREFAGDTSPRDMRRLFALMALAQCERDIRRLCDSEWLQFHSLTSRIDGWHQTRCSLPSRNLRKWCGG
jgi:cyclase